MRLYKLVSLRGPSDVTDLTVTQDSAARITPYVADSVVTGGVVGVGREPGTAGTCGTRAKMSANASRSSRVDQMGSIVTRRPFSLLPHGRAAMGVGRGGEQGRGEATGRRLRDKSL